MKLLKKTLKKNNLKFIGLIVFALVGTILIFRTFASVPNQSIQAESATLTDGATKVSDSAASGGEYVAFGGTVRSSETCSNEPLGLPCLGDIANLQNKVIVTTAAEFVDAINGAVPGTNIIVAADLNLEAYQMRQWDAPDDGGLHWDGVYFFDVIGSSNAYIRITGDPNKPRPKIIGGLRFYRSSYVEVRHIEFLQPKDDSRYNEYQSGIGFYDGSHHMRAYGNYIHDFSSCGLCAQGTTVETNGEYIKHIDFRYNIIENVARRDRYGSSAISIYRKGSLSGDARDSVTNYVIGNSVSEIRRDNYEDWYSGGCIFFDKGYEVNGVTLVANNVCSGTDGRAFTVKNYGNVRLINNTFHNTAQKGAPVQVEFCNGHDMIMSHNIIVGSKNAYAQTPGASYCNLDGEIAGEANRSISLMSNVWVAAGGFPNSTGDLVVSSATQVLVSPSTTVPLVLSNFYPLAAAEIGKSGEVTIAADLRPRTGNYAGALEP